MIAPSCAFMVTLSCVESTKKIEFVAESRSVTAATRLSPQFNIRLLETILQSPVEVNSATLRLAVTLTLTESTDELQRWMANSAVVSGQLVRHSREAKQLLSSGIR